MSSVEAKQHSCFGSGLRASPPPPHVSVRGPALSLAMPIYMNKIKHYLFLHDFSVTCQSNGRECIAEGRLDQQVIFAGTALFLATTVH